MSQQIFISLTKRDSEIAEALRDLLRSLFGEWVDVRFSTSKHVGESPGHGQDWFKWIVERVLECKLAYILVTPSSLRKPWIPWESGAVFGAALASGEAGLNKVRPLIYRLSSDQVPSPIASSKANYVRGDRPDDVRSMLKGLIDDYIEDYSKCNGRRLNPDDMAKLVNRVNDDDEEGVIKNYLRRVDKALGDAPVVPTSAVVEEWRIRLDRLLEEGRGSEVDQFDDWLDIAFGREAQDQPQPLDLRLHSRLAHLYLEARKPQKAMEQLEVALQLMPRDIYLLRQLGQAHLAANDARRAGEAIERIRKLDGKAFVRNAECAALLGKWYRAKDDLPSAESTYLAAFRQNRKSNYLADLLAQVRLDQGKVEEAREAYGWALDIIEKLHENNLWTSATAANAAFFNNDDEKAMTYLRVIRGLQPRPSPRELDTIADGLERLARRLDDGTARVAKLVGFLRS